jgi:hypothetical protein
MAAQKTKEASLKTALSRFANRVSKEVPAAQGSIHIRCTDCDDEYSLESLGQSPRIVESLGKGAPIVRITGPSSALRDVLEGRIEASEALVRGGIRVRGDIEYLERALRDVGLLSCK